ncbi:hypothetical protein V8C35DRAFT_286218 [Trichoderma chlorosporum]
MVFISAMMFYTLLLLGLSSTTLAASNFIPHKPPAHLLAQLSPSSHFQDASIVISAQCRPGEVVCNDGCMPSFGECCSDGGGFCKQGYACVTDGCCPIGKTCGDEITCDLGEVPCGEKKCMPKDGVCCPSGSYCAAGEECFQNGFNHYCRRVGESGKPDGGSGSKTTGGTIGIGETTSFRHQSTSLSKSTHGDVPASTAAETQTQVEESTSTSTSISSTSSKGTSSVLGNTGHPVFTPFLPIPSTTSTTTTEVTSSSTSETSPTTTTSNGNPAGLKVSGVTLGLMFVSIMMLL